MNKFKIRDLKNQRRMIDKKISKLEKLEDKRLNTVVVAKIQEKGKAEICINGTEEKEIILHHVDVEFKHYNREVICTIRDRRVPSVVAVGVAKCIEGETFDKKVGMTIAEYRARSKYYEQLAKYFIENL